MEYKIYRPDRKQEPRTDSVGLNTLRHLQTAPVISAEITPPTEEYINELWVREAAMASLRGIQANLKPGLHRRQESFAEIARDEIGTRWRRVRTFIGSVAARITNAIPYRAPQEYGGLADIGFGDEPLETYMATLPEAPVSPAVGLLPPTPETGRQQDWLSPLQASSYFTQEELAQMRRAVAATHQQKRGTVYYGGEYAGSDAQ